MSNGVAPGGIEYYLPLFFDTTATLADYLPQDAVVALVGDVAAAVERFWQDTDSRYKLLRGDKARPLLPPPPVFLPPDAFNGALKALARVEIPAPASEPARGADASADGRAAARRRSTAAPTIRSPRSSAISPPATRAC